MEVFLHSITSAGFRQLDRRGLSVYRYDLLSELFPDVWSWSRGQIIRRYSIEIRKRSVSGDILEGGQPFLVNDTETAPGMSPNLPEGIRSFVGVPIYTYGVPWGVLYVNSPEPNNFTDDDVAFSEALARQIGSFAAEDGGQGGGNVELSTVRALAATVDAKDPYTRHHSTNVSFFSRRLAREMNLDPAEVHRIDLAAMLHDIGKIAIPDEVLQKPSRLSSEERILLQTHASLGANILAQASHLQHLVPLVRHHHEWVDGNGYPDRLVGDDIPLGASIISVADAFDTMTSNRVYRSARDVHKTLDELRRCCGTQFHPDVVRAMENVIEKATHAQEPWLAVVGSNQESTTNEFSSPYGWNGALEDISLNVSQNRDPLELIMEAQQIQYVMELPLMLDKTGEQALNFWSADAVQIYLVDRASGNLKLAWSGGSAAGQRFLATCRAEETTPMVQGLLGWAVLSNQAVCLSDATRDPRWAYPSEFDGPVSVLVTPLAAGGAPVGAMQLVCQGGSRFSRSDAKVLSILSSLLGQGVSRILSLGADRDLIYTDSLTGLWNANQLTVYLDRLAQQGLEQPMTVAFFDGDNIKGANDRYGYEAGDKIICHIARCLKGWLRPGDVLIRYGGDKFMVFFPGLTLPEAGARLEGMRMVISEMPVEVKDGERLFASVSCGVTEVRPELGPYRAIRAAEQAAFNAKRTGKNRVWTAAV